MTWSRGMPVTSEISSATISGCAASRSILLTTGMSVSPASTARYRLASVCASMPWAASTTRRAPSQAASDLETS